MSVWDNHDEIRQALPPTDDHKPIVDTKPIIDPQAAGWVPATGYDYATYNKSNRELAEAMVAQGAPSGEEVLGAVGGITSGDWASNAAQYPWNDEYGDVGPKFPELEKQLFGSEFHVKAGIQFETIAKIDVIQEGPVKIKAVLRFEDAGLHPVMLENISLAGYNVPTPIQMYTIPAVVQGYDLIACAQTGSGKTAAFLIPILSKLMGKAKKLAAPRPNPAMYPKGAPQVRAEPLVLIVVPTRELATQIFDEARRFCYRTMFRPCVVYGGGPLSDQIAQLSKGCDLLIGTPGRLVDFITRPHLLTLKRLKYMVLDEADETVGADWDTELRQIMSGGDQEDGDIKYLMFSATFAKIARDLAKQHLSHDHVHLRVGRVGSTHTNIVQDIIECSPENKRKCLQDLLMSIPPGRTIVFVNSKRTCDEVDDFLFNLGFPCTSIHGDRTQREREDSIRAFRAGKTPILIATGVSARGLDIHHVNHVINFDLPSSNFGGIQEYIHRIGRTGRIGNLGRATSFYTKKDVDIAPMLVKLLLENKQIVPVFLSTYVPEGFNKGERDLTKLDFEDDSDVEGDDGENGGESGGAWGRGNTSSAAVTGWGESNAAAATAGGPDGDTPGAITDDWGRGNASNNVSSGWGGGDNSGAAAGGWVTASETKLQSDWKNADSSHAVSRAAAQVTAASQGQAIRGNVSQAGADSWGASHIAERSQFPSGPQSVSGSSHNKQGPLQPRSNNFNAVADSATTTNYAAPRDATYQPQAAVNNDDWDLPAAEAQHRVASSSVDHGAPVSGASLQGAVQKDSWGGSAAPVAKAQVTTSSDSWGAPTSVQKITTNNGWDSGNSGNWGANHKW